MQKIFAVALATLMFAGPAFAQKYSSATVYRTTPNGVYLQTRDGVTYVPNNSVDFRNGSTTVRFNQLRAGQPYQYRYTNNSYKPTYYPQQYVESHKDWDWNRYQQGWQKERTVWVRDSNGNWTKRR